MKQGIGYFRIFITVATLLCLAAPGVFAEEETVEEVEEV
jgi:hypothetical protein